MSTAPGTPEQTKPAGFDPARAVGRFLGIVFFRAIVGPKPPAPSLPPEEQAAVDANEAALNACLNRWRSPAALLVEKTRAAIETAEKMLGTTHVDTNGVAALLDELRGRKILLERRGLEHLPEYSYIASSCDELTRRWRSSREAQGESTAQQAARGLTFTAAPAPVATTTSSDIANNESTAARVVAVYAGE